MKHFAKILTLGAALVASVPAALAVPISGTIGFGGNGSLTSSGAFTAGANVSGTSSNAYVNVGGTGTLAGFTMFNPANFFSFNTGTTVGPITPNQPVFTTTEVINGVSTTLTFTLTGLTSAPDSSNVGFGFAGTGILTETGYTNTAANFTLATNSSAGTFVTFNTAAAATPEPSSLIMLGTGLMSAAGMLVRRRKIS